MDSKNGGKLTQRDLAKRAGVTQMTVSLALRGAAGVSAETVERIRKLAKEMGYAPNPLVSSLMRTRRGRGQKEVGLSIAWHGAITSLRTRDRGRADLCDTYAEMLAGAQEACRRNGFRLEVFPHGEPSGDLPRLLKARGISGLILAPIGHKAVRQFQIDPNGPIHLAGLGHEGRDESLDRVVSNAFDEMTQCVAVLVKVGCRRIGYLDLTNHELSSGGRWKGAYHVAVSMAGRDPCPTDWEAIPKQQVRDQLEGYIRKNRPDGMIIGSRSLIRAMIARSKAGRHIPFACLERNAWPQWISGVETDFHQIGDDTAQLLVDRILAPYAGAKTHRTIAVHSSWHEGTSHLASKDVPR